MATPQLAHLRTPARAPLPPAPKTAFCHHQYRDGQFCNRSSHPELRYCFWHLPSIPKKIVSLVRSAKLYLFG